MISSIQHIFLILFRLKNYLLKIINLDSIPAKLSGCRRQLKKILKCRTADHNKPEYHQTERKEPTLSSRVEAVLLACPRTNRPRRGHLPVVAGVTNHHCYRGQDFKVLLVNCSW